MSAYLFVKYVHVACVVLSLAGFAARGALMLRGSALLQARFVRVAPHVVDTLLGAIALRHGRRKGVRAWAFAGALLAAAYVVVVALTKNPVPFSS